MTAWSGSSRPGQVAIDKLTRGTIWLLVGLTIAAIGVAVLVGFA